MPTDSVSRPSPASDGQASPLPRADEGAALEAVLETSERRRLLAVEAAGVGDWTYDVARGTLAGSPLARAMHRVPPGAPLTLAVHDALLHPDDRAAVQARRAHALDPAGSGQFRAEFRFRFPDGEIRWFEAVGQTLFADAPGGRRATHLLGAMLDVTARRHADRAGAALHESEARYRALFEAIDEGFCVVEVLVDDAGRPADYRFIEANPAFVSQTGLENAVGRTVRDLVPGIEAHWIETYGRVAATGESMRFQQGSDAMGRWFDVYAFRVGAPADRRVALLFSDVSAARRAEQERARLVAALEVERARLAEIVRLAPAFMAVLHGPAHVFALTNGGYDALVGHRDVRGRSVADALPEAAAQGFVALLDRVLETGEPFVGHEIAYRRPRAAGGEEVRYLDFVYQALTEPDGTRSGVFVHGVDITEQVRARAEVERLLADSERARHEAEAAQRRAESASREADEANRAKSAFLATMSHELRTPLNAILGYTQLLEIGLVGPLTDGQRGYLDRLTVSGQHLLGLVDDILDLSKIEAGEARVAQRDAWTGPPVRAALDLVRPQASVRDVHLVDARPDEQGVAFVGDEDRVRQVVLNLLSNAVKFTPAGGTVTVVCDPVQERPAAATELRGAGPWAAVRVEDTGIGIAPEEQARIFDPFHQVDHGHTRTAGGTGLGLAISRRLARLMGGDLTVESTPGAGSAFTLWLPAARLADGAQVETAAERRARGARAIPLRADGLGAVGAALRGALDEVLGAYADRLSDDPEIPQGRDLRRIQLEDHQASFLADLAQSLVIVEESGQAAEDELRDGSAIQRAIADAHGARRHAHGFDEAALRRDHRILREEVERAVRGRLPAGGPVDVETAVGVLLGLLDRAESASLRAWRRAADRDRQ